ncbi:MAG: AMP-binding protein [Deltaproteobacteria bacterium]|nr:MAG: AMP-binding protein [Deltaproteobacteria bacterium]
MSIEGFTPYAKEQEQLYNKYRWWLGLTWGDVLDRASDLYPGKVGLVDDSCRLTYGELRDKVDRLAKGLVELGIQKHDFVLIQIPNWHEYVIAFFAAQKIGAVAVLLLPRHTELEINHLSTLTKPKAWILPERYRRLDYLPIIEKVRQENPQLEHIISVRPEKAIGSISLEQLIEDARLTENDLRGLESRRPDPMAVAQIMPTGGTTGLPKAAPRTHNSFLCNVEYHSRAWEITSEDTVLTIAPVSHGQGMLCGVGGAIFNFAKFVLIDSTEPVDICRVIERERVTAIPTVPAIIIRLINFERLKQYDLTSLKKVYAGGAASTPDLVKNAVDRLNCKFVNAFGSVEGSNAMTRLDDDFVIVCNTVGKKCCPYENYKIVDPNENALPPNTEGQLVTKGPGIFTGYFKSAEENQDIFTRDGFFKTGDLAKIDESGNIKITGRIKDIIIRGGENISAVDIEKLISSHPRVEDVAVIGMPDTELGERICAYIQAASGTTLSFQETISFLKEKGASVLQLPERIEFVDSIPLTKVGKADKEALRADIRKRLAIS